MISERRRFAERALPGRRVPVARSVPSDCLTPVMLFRRLRAGGREAFLLESVEGGESIARYTFLGAAPAARFTVRDGRASLETNGVAREIPGPPLEALDRLVRRPGFVPDPELPPLVSGAVGYLAYDAVRLFERIPDAHPATTRMPDALFLTFDAVAAFDHPRHRLLLLTVLDATEGRTPAAAADEAIARLDALEAMLFTEVPAAPAEPIPSEASRFDPETPKARFLENVAAAREAIGEGEIYQVVLSQRWTARLSVDPFDVYRALRALNPSPYLFYLETREASVLGSSPEMLVRCRGRDVETRPIAGTVRRGADAAEDERLAAQLAADPKERAEHVMLVDLARNDLGRICEIGSVAVARYAHVERFSHVQHLVSEVGGRLAEGRTAADALASCFPAGTLTGAPKIRAMEIIDGLETSRRGLYGGAVGYFDAAGNCDLAIAIRAAVAEGGVLRVQAGAGIVADSVPEREYAEAESKAAALFRAVELAREWFGGAGTPVAARGVAS
ncbi:MAG TPA: anthranilate synthase component I [Thermoanaerobaculia bacterium]|nr:anthranilate synthase component I [Thermoanaerobaculia bacterium]